MDVVGWIRDDRGARPAWLRYAAAVVVVLLASFLSVALHPWLLSAPLAPYFAAVAFVAWFGGFGPAIATLVLSLPPITLFALEPLGTWSVTRDEEAALVIFVLVSALLALLTASRDRAAHTARESEARFQLAQEASNVGVWDWEIATGRTYWSEAMWRLYGLVPGADPPGNAFWLPSLHLDDRPRVTAAIDRLLASPATEFRDEFRVVDPDGAERWIEVIARVTRDAAGHPVRMSGVNLEITERKVAETAMLAARTRAEALAEATRVLTETDPGRDTALEAIADLAARHVGDLAVVRLLTADGHWLEAVAVGHPHTAARTAAAAALASEHHPADQGVNGAALRTGKPQRLDSAELAARQAATPELWPPLAGVPTAVLLAVPLRAQDRAIGTLSVSRGDVDRPYDEEDERFLQELADRAGLAFERARLFTQLRASEDRLRLAVEANRMVAWEWVPASDQITTSDTFADIYGLPALAGATERFALVWPEDLPSHQEKVARIGREGGSYQSLFRITRPVDGELVWLEEHATAVRNGDGRVERVVGVVIDVTARKQAEQIRAANEARQAFLLALNDAVQPLDDPHAIAAEASRLLGERLDVNRVSFAEIDGSDAIVRNGYVNGVAPLVGRLAIADFGAALLQAYHAGETVVVDDVRRDPRLTDTERARYATADIAAFAEVMLIKGGQWVGAFGVQSATPRVWSDDEIALIGEVAERIWVAAERARAEAALRASEAHARFLAQASEVLAKSLDDREAVAQVMRLAVPLLADWCVVDLLREDGALHRIALVHADPERTRLAEDLRRRYPVLTPDLRHTAWQVLRSGQPRVDPDVTAARLADEFGDEAHVALMRRLGFASELAVPLVARDRALGVLILVMGDSGRRFAAADVAFAEELARHCALAIDNVRLYREARDAEAKVSRLFDAGVIGLLVADAEQILEANDAFLRLMGYTREDLESGELRWAALLAPEYAQLEADSIAEIEERGFCTPFETEYFRKDGSRAPILIGAASVHGTKPPWICAVLDLTEQKAAERDRAAFVEAATHDLKTPLTSLKGRVQLLLRRMRRTGVLDPADLEAALTAVDGDVIRLVTLIDELMDMAHLRAGLSLGLRLAPVDLVALAEECAEAAWQRSGQHIIRVAAELPALVGEWDKARLERVVTNVLDNAVKYSPDGSEIVVRVACEQDASGTWAVLAVADQGVGIPAADLPRIFERFQRGGNVSGIGGAGIGLAGARQIVTQHGGTIAVVSSEGVGSTFTVRLPLGSP